MFAATVALLLAAAPPSAQQAKALATSKNWDELYLAFSAAAPSKYEDAERRAIGGYLHKGCEALLKGDAVMAYSLGDKAVAFDESADALLCLAKAARAADQRGAAEQALRKGLAAYPDKADAFAFLLGQQLLEDKDAAGAAELLGRVPKKAREYKQAQALLKKARAEQASDRDARQQAKALERRIERGAAGGGESPVQVATGDGRGRTAPASSGLTYESGESAGMRTRGNGRFTFKYFNHDRDFGQRAEYEGVLAATMDEAYETAQRILGQAREAPVDVVMYTREEFATHVSARLAQRAAGVYSDDSIRVNDAAEMNRQNKAVLVHEYVHAVVDEASGSQAGRLPLWLNEGLAEYVEWRYLGSDDPPLPVKSALKGAAKGNHLPQLAQMDRNAPINEANPGLAYGFSAVAVRVLLKDGGASKLMDLIRDVGHGQSFETLLSERYGRTVARLQEQAREDVE